MTKRVCYYVNETMETLAGTIPAIVTEGEPGYAPLIGNGDHASPWYWGSFETAKLLARKANEELGLTPEDVNEIILSSMKAGPVPPQTHINYSEEETS